MTPPWTALSELPRRGEVWLVALGASRAGEPGKHRPAIVVSSNELLGASDRDLLVVVPVSASRAPGALRPVVGTHEGVERPSVAVPRAIRAVARTRCLTRLGTLDTSTVRAVTTALAAILELDSSSHD